MKILLRAWGDNEHCIWKDAKYTANGFEVDGSRVYEQNIISVFKDNRSAYVKCSICGAVFRKGSKKWQQHITKTCDASKCFNCRNLYISESVVKGKKFKLMENGNYTISQKSEAKLLCKSRYNYYSYPDINAEEARTNCIYNKCVSAEPMEITDFFTKYPDAFNELATVDKVVDVGYKDISSSWDGCKEYLLKCRNILWVRVNTKQIVDCVLFSYRNNNWNLYYSKKYDRIFTLQSNKYVPWNPYGVNRDTISRVTDKIKSLYE